METPRSIDIAGEGGEGAGVVPEPDRARPAVVREKEFQS